MENGIHSIDMERLGIIIALKLFTLWLKCLLIIFFYFNLAVHEIGLVWLEKLILRVWVRCNFSRYIKYKNLFTNDVMDFWNSLRSRFRCEWTSKFARVAKACIAIKSSWKFTNASNHISVLQWIFCASMHLHIASNTVWIEFRFLVCQWQRHTFIRYDNCNIENKEILIFTIIFIRLYR